MSINTFTALKTLHEKPRLCAFARNLFVQHVGVQLVVQTRGLMTYD